MKNHIHESGKEGSTIMKSNINESEKEGSNMSWVFERWEVEKYTVSIRDREDLGIHVGRNEISLHLKPRDVDTGPVYVTIRFIRAGDAGASGEDVRDTHRSLWVYMREQSFAPMIDLLRNEKPIYWFWNPTKKPPWGMLRTDVFGGEPVGEGE